MKSSKIGFLFAAIALGGLVGCDDDNTAVDAGPTVDAPPTADVNPLDPDAAPMDVIVDTDITTNTTWTFPNTYILGKHVFVKNGAVLTIEPGVIILGDMATSLVITREGRIEAVGTAAKPIVFTSGRAVGERGPGNWGGLVLLGKADLNIAAVEQGVEGFPAGTPDVLYGGSDDTHNCGTLKYVRVEFAGFILENNKELNGITVGGCGSQTTIDFVQVHKNADDGIEFFGGTTDLKHAVITQGLDDGLDWDLGWRGKVQFLVSQTGLGDGESGFEGANSPTSPFNQSPRAIPVIYNVTLIGKDDPTGKTKYGMILKEGTGGRIFNTIIMGYGGLPIDVRIAAGTVDQPGPADLFVMNSIFFGNPNQGTWADATDNDQGFEEAVFFKAGAMNNKEVDPKLPAAASDFAAPNFKPDATSPALVEANAAVPDAAQGFDASAKFIGAIGTDDWTAGWTAYPQN